MGIDANIIIDERLAVRMRLDRYDGIMRKVYTVDVSNDAGFQRLFNGFYRVRRNVDWRKKYYELFEIMKTKTATFAVIITNLFEKTGNIEPSFSSKMLATLNPNKPIWDLYVVQNLGLRLSGKSKKEQLDNAIKLYSDIEKWYSNFLNTDDAKKCLTVFDDALPRYTWLSDVKKVDYFLWSNCLQLNAVIPTEQKELRNQSIQYLKPYPPQKELRSQFIQYLKQHYGYKRPEIMASNVFYVWHNDIGIDFWEIFETDDSMYRAKFLLEERFMSIGRKDPKGHATVHYGCWKRFREFLTESQISFR